MARRFIREGGASTTECELYLNGGRAAYQFMQQNVGRDADFCVNGSLPVDGIVNRVLTFISCV